ncbi:MAG: DUF481 domain-containing protein [Xanthomonadales bacterium]|nr:DUF481 domain-containing protein [Xanthomonadales bacterium]
MKTRFSYIALLVSLVCFSTAGLADKTDVIIMENGDRISGEVKGLVGGQLELKTDYMGTVFIDWEDIQELVSDNGQQIELGDGNRLVGTLDKKKGNANEKSEMMIVHTDEGQIEIDSANVVRMYPVGGDFWDRMDLSFSLGFNYDKNSAVGKYNFGVDAIYRDPEFITMGRISSEFTTQNETDNTKRNVLNVNHMSWLPNKRYRNYFGSMEQNDQLGIDLRTLVGAGYGWVPISNGHNWFTLGVGLAANVEKPFDNSESDANLEAVGTLRYQYYKRNIPERTLDVYFQVYPSITQWGRVRADFTFDARWELIRDFFIGMELYSSFDGEPAALEGSEIDYGIRTTVGLKF